MKRIAIVLLFAASLVSCSSTETYEQLVGEWECTSWVTTSVGKNKCKGDVNFKFDAEKNYSSAIGSIKDTGSFKVISKLLYFQPEGKMELVVEINKLNTDTLEYIMNQAGEEEILTLVRVK